MNCCHGNNSNEKNKHKTSHKSHMSHMWMMILCCGAPVFVLLLLPIIGKNIPGTSGYLSKIIPFLCPIMMLSMIPMMFKKNHRDSENTHCENKQIKDET